jgi:ribosomal-protein-alanine N-acetyltransferase
VSEVRVTAATLADIPAVSRIERSAFSDPWSDNSFRSLPGDPRAFFACARGQPAQSGIPSGETTVVGYVVAVFVADQGEIVNLAVAAESRGQGVGTALLDAALREAESRHSSALFLEVRESNAAARRLYGARGFAEVGRRRGYYRHPDEDGLILRRAAGPGFK